jgi:hypothetical protein
MRRSGSRATMRKRRIERMIIMISREKRDEVIKQIEVDLRSSMLRRLEDA